MGAKRPGGKRPGGKRLGGETTRGGNGLGAKRPGFLSFFLSFVCMFRPFIGAPPFGVVKLVLIKVTN